MRLACDGVVIIATGPGPFLVPPELPSPQSEQSRWFSDEVQPHEPALRSYLRGAFPTMQNDVDDVVQESLLRVWRARAKSPINSAKAFLFKVARHLAIDVTRRNKVSPIDSVRDMEGLPVLQDGNGVVDAVSMQEKARILAQAIDSLPARCREVVILRKLQGLSQKETAARLGLAEKTIEAQLQRGIKRCEIFLRKRGLSDYYSDE